MTNDNPWGIPPGELKAVRAVCEHGTTKGAARALNLSVKTIDFHLASAKKRMGVRFGLHVLLWIDRWERSQLGDTV